jgi:CubicO group peptidase (beta-lactamase class C family)
MKKLFFVLVLLVASKGFGQVQSSLPDSVTSKIDSAINAQMVKKHIVGASIAIVDHGKIVYAKGYGFADNRKKIKTTDKTVFCIGSITKTFTAMAIMKLHEEGKIDLDKPASYYLPELKIKSVSETGDILKIRNLLSHTSGLTDGFMNKDMCDNQQDMTSIIDDLNQEELVNKTNWKWSYSNVGYDVLGCIIERVSGMKYMDYIRKNFLQKMEMASSDFLDRPNDTTYSRGYLNDTTQTLEPFMRDIPAGALFCSAPDMANFMKTIQNKGNYGSTPIISQASITEMQTDHTDHTTIPSDVKYGYATFILPMEFNEDSLYGDAVGHGGDTYTSHSLYFVFPKADLGIVLLTNSEKGHSFVNGAFRGVFKSWMRYEKGIKLNPPKTLKKTIPSTEQLSTREIVGDYATGEDIMLKFRRINDHKMVMKQGGQHFILKRLPDGNFTATLKILMLYPYLIKGLEIGFDKIDGKIYSKQVDVASGNGDYIAKKDSSMPIPDSWKKMAGKYKMLNSCEGNMQGIPQQLSIHGNKIWLKVRFSKKEIETMSFNALDDTYAAADGLDRRGGEVMKILPNGHIYFSGYEMERE